MNNLKAFMGRDIPPSELVEAMDKCIVLRERKLYPAFEMTPYNEQCVMDDMLAWIIRMEDHAVIQAVLEGQRRGLFSNFIMLDAAKVKEILDKQKQKIAYGYCPRCHEPLHPKFNECYCGKCGQAVKWNNINDAPEEVYSDAD